MTPKPEDLSGAVERERIARIIDPDLWDTLDYICGLPHGVKDAAQRLVEPSLAKADEILANFSTLLAERDRLLGLLARAGEASNQIRIEAEVQQASAARLCRAASTLAAIEEEMGK